MADDELPGFGYPAAAVGAASYVIRYRTQRRFTIGRPWRCVARGGANMLAQAQRRRRSGTTQTRPHRERKTWGKSSAYVSSGSSPRWTPTTSARWPKLARSRDAAAGEADHRGGGSGRRVDVWSRGAGGPSKVREAAVARCRSTTASARRGAGWGAVVEPHATPRRRGPRRRRNYPHRGHEALPSCDANKQLGYVVFKNIGEVMSARLAGGAWPGYRRDAPVQDLPRPGLRRAAPSAGIAGARRGRATFSRSRGFGG